VKPGSNVAALREKNPPPRKSHATKLTQRQRRRHDKFLENFVGLARMLNLFSASYSSLSIFPAIPRPMLLCAHGRATQMLSAIPGSTELCVPGVFIFE
jgi:hypothetical protein